MAKPPTNLELRAANFAHIFGAAVRERRIASQMTQDELAMAAGVGRRFIIDLEAGKPSCQLGKSLLVAEALGARSADLFRQTSPKTSADDLPPPMEEND